jgi:hypothetical protein
LGFHGIPGKLSGIFEIRALLVGTFFIKKMISMQPYLFLIKIISNNTFTIKQIISSDFKMSIKSKKTINSNPPTIPPRGG